MSEIDDVEGAPLPDEVATSEVESENPAETQEVEAPEADSEVSAEAGAEVEEAEEPADQQESRSARKRRLRREREAEKDRALSEAEKEIARLSEQLEAIKAPDFSTYQNPDDYTADRAAHAAQKQILEANAERARLEAERAKSDVVEAKRQAVEEVFSEGQQAHQDFQAVVSNPHLPVSEGMLQAAVEADNSADVLYYLGKNTDEAARIHALSPVAQAVEIGRLSTKLSAPKIKTTKAPPPPKQVSGASGKADKSPSDMSYTEYVEWRKKGGGR